MESVQERIEELDCKVSKLKKENWISYFMCTLSLLAAVLSMAVLASNLFQICCFFVFFIISCDIVKDININNGSIKYLEKEKNFLLSESKSSDDNTLINYNNKTINSKLVDDNNKIVKEIKSIKSQQIPYLIIIIIIASLSASLNLVWLASLLAFFKLYIETNMRQVNLHDEMSKNNFLLNKAIYESTVENNMRSGESNNLGEKKIEHSQQKSNSISHENERIIDAYINSLENLPMDDIKEKVKTKSTNE